MMQMRNSHAAIFRSSRWLRWDHCSTFFFTAARARVCVSMSLRVRAHRPQFANYCFFCCGRVFFCRRATVVLRWSGNCTLHTTHTQRWKCILNRWITRTKINYSNINNEQGGCVWFFGWANAANARLSLTFRLAVHANRGWERNDGRWAVFDMCGVLPI